MDDVDRRLGWQLLREPYLSDATSVFEGRMRGAQHVSAAMENGRPKEHRVEILSRQHTNEGKQTGNW